MSHYTTPEGCRGILTSGEIWCTDLRDVNDPREGDHGLDVIREVLCRKSVPDGFRVRVLREGGLFGLKDSWQQYVACFCEAEGQDHMWRDYADGGRGHAIVFDFEGLLRGCGDDRKYSLFRVLYDRDEQTRYVEGVVNHAIRLQRKHDLKRDDREQYWKVCVTQWLLVCGVRFKDPQWSAEEEFRRCKTGGSKRDARFRWGAETG